MVKITLREQVIFAAIVWFCWAGSGPAKAEELRQNTVGDSKTVKQVMQQMTIEEKLGQMFMVGFDGMEVAGEIKTLIEEYHIGNVIVFERNVKGMRPWNNPPLPLIDDLSIPKNVAGLTNSLQDAVKSLTREQTVRIPLFIAIDQENGSQVRIEKGITLLPGNIALGQTRDTDLAFQSGHITATELRAMGITMNLAPVMDVNTNDKNDIIGDRAFAGNVDIVSELGVAFMKGLHSRGVVAVGKHFPGHGDSKVDPHNTLPVVNYPLHHLDKINIPPFKSLIANGVAAIMPAHMYFTELSSQKGLPISLDKRVLENKLRRELNFAGVIIGDDISRMRAITSETRGIKQAIEMSIEAGNDIVMLAHFSDIGLKQFTDIFRGLVNHYRNRPDCINSSVERILLLKMRVKSDLDANKWKVNPTQIEQSIRTKENLKKAQEIADSSIVLVSENGNNPSDLKNTVYFDGSNYPLKNFKTGDTILVVSPVFAPPNALSVKLKDRNKHQIKSVLLVYGWHDREAQKTATSLWNKEELNATIIFTSRRPTSSEVAQAAKTIVAAAHEVCAIIFGVVKREHADILQNVVSEITNVPIFAIAFREPYYLPVDVLKRENVISLAAGSNLDPSIEAVVKVLYGENDLKPKGNDYISVSIEDWIDRKAGIGAEVIRSAGLRKTPQAALQEPKSKPKTDQQKGPIPPAGPGPKIWIGLLWCYLIGLVGAAAAFVLSPSLPGGLWTVKKQDGTLRAGFIPSVFAQAVFGLLLYMIVFIAILIADKIPQIPFLTGVPADKWFIYLPCGFVGGFFGKSFLKAIPYLKNLGD